MFSYICLQLIFWMNKCIYFYFYKFLSFQPLIFIKANFTSSLTLTPLLFTHNLPKTKRKKKSKRKIKILVKKVISKKNVDIILLSNKECLWFLKKKNPQVIETKIHNFISTAELMVQDKHYDSDNIRREADVLRNKWSTFHAGVHQYRSQLDASIQYFTLIDQARRIFYCFSWEQCWAS